MKMLAALVPEEHCRALDRMARARKVPRSEVVRVALSVFIADPRTERQAQRDRERQRTRQAREATRLRVWGS